MKLLITYASAGAGHLKAAQALYHYCKENCQAADVKIVDILEKTHPLFRKIYSKGYSFLVNHAPWIWQFSFWLTSVKFLRAPSKIINFIVDRLNAEQFIRFLIQENPDCIISTHFFPSEIAAYLKRTRRINSKLLTVVTDFAVHPFWIHEPTDIYIVASAFAKKQLASEAGVREVDIKELGIPIDSKFLIKYDRNILSEKFRIQQNKFTVLIVTGSFGLGPIEKIVELLYQDIQVLVVCANNKRLYTRLKKKNYPNVAVFGFIDNIQELMAVSEVIVTKPGGLTISEVLAMELVPVFISPIPGQETENVKVLAQNGVGLTMNDVRGIKNIILDFRNHPDKIKMAKDNMSLIRKPFAAREICNAVCKGGLGLTC